MKISVFSLNVKERENPLESFLGLGCLLFGIRSSLKQSCVSGRERSQLLVYPSFLVRNLPCAQERVGCSRLPQSIQQQGRGCGERGSCRTVNLCTVLPYEIKPYSVSWPRGKDWSKPGVRLCRQGRLAGLGKVMVPARSFAVGYDDVEGGRRKFSRMN